MDKQKIITARIGQFSVYTKYNIIMSNFTIINQVYVGNLTINVYDLINLELESPLGADIYFYLYQSVCLELFVEGR